MNINLKKIGFFAISGLLMMPCSNDDLGNTNIENIDSSQINNNISQLNQRVEIVNEPIVFNSNSEKSEADFENKTLSSNQANDYSFIGNYQYNGSANFVDHHDNFIFVANGVGGLKIIRKDYN